MKLTGKAKEEFEKWFAEEQVSELGNTYNGFYGLYPSFQYGVYVDFFWHEGGELILTSESVQVDILNGYTTIEEAREQAIKKANEIFNNRIE